jgi:hypothetical protein
VTEAQSLQQMRLLTQVTRCGENSRLCGKALTLTDGFEDVRDDDVGHLTLIRLKVFGCDGLGAWEAA